MENVFLKQNVYFYNVFLSNDGYKEENLYKIIIISLMQCRMVVMCVYPSGGV
jgi:hypothetical protein